MKLVIVRALSLWEGQTTEEVFMEVPRALDMKKEEDRWFAKGGGTAKDFADHLVRAGGRILTDVAVWNINYQS